jgi:hypothetical protein
MLTVKLIYHASTLFESVYSIHKAKIPFILLSGLPMNAILILNRLQPYCYNQIILSNMLKDGIILFFTEQRLSLNN